jgi:hypothetical protein
MLHIITNFELSDKNKDVLNEFNTYYNSWIDSCINDLSFMEMQSKLLCLLQYIHKSIKINNGLLQMCKLTPNIKLRYISDETNSVVQICQQEQGQSSNTQDPLQQVVNEEETLMQDTNNENTTTDDEINNQYEILELGEMLITCITHYASVFEQSDFENLGGPMNRIVENTEKIESLQKILYEYRDLEAIFSD